MTEIWKQLTVVGLAVACFSVAQSLHGSGYIAAFTGGPFPQVTFCPTGGISIDNYKSYLDLENVACVGGSWLAPTDALEQGDWHKITNLAQKAIA